MSSSQCENKAEGWGISFYYFLKYLEDMSVGFTEEKLFSFKDHRLLRHLQVLACASGNANANANVHKAYLNGTDFFVIKHIIILLRPFPLTIKMFYVHKLNKWIM